MLNKQEMQLLTQRPGEKTLKRPDVTYDVTFSRTEQFCHSVIFHAFLKVNECFALGSY